MYMRTDINIWYKMVRIRRLDVALKFHRWLLPTYIALPEQRQQKRFSERRRNCTLFRESKLSLGEIIEPVFFPVKFANGEPKDDPRHGRQDGNCHVVPYEQRIGGQGCSGTTRSDTTHHTHA